MQSHVSVWGIIHGDGTTNVCSLHLLSSACDECLGCSNKLAIMLHTFGRIVWPNIAHCGWFQGWGAVKAWQGMAGKGLCSCASDKVILSIQRPYIMNRFRGGVLHWSAWESAGNRQCHGIAGICHGLCRLVVPCAICGELLLEVVKHAVTCQCVGSYTWWRDNQWSL